MNSYPPRNQYLHTGVCHLALQKPDHTASDTSSESCIDQGTVPEPVLMWLGGAWAWEGLRLFTVVSIRAAHWRAGQPVGEREAIGHIMRSVNGELCQDSMEQVTKHCESRWSQLKLEKYLAGLWYNFLNYFGITCLIYLMVPVEILYLGQVVESSVCGCLNLNHQQNIGLHFNCPST